MKRAHGLLIAGALAGATALLVSCSVLPPVVPPTSTTAPTTVAPTTTSGPTTTSSTTTTVTTTVVPSTTSTTTVVAPAGQVIWVDPAAGDDSRLGTTRAQAVRTLGRAWSIVPDDVTTVANGVSIRLVAGTYPYSSIQNNWWENKHGNATHPISVVAADAPAVTTLDGGVNIFNVGYITFSGVTFVAGGSHPAATDTVFHAENLDHLTLDHVVVTGDRNDMKESLKVNQSAHVNVTNSKVSGAWDNPIDFVAVQGINVTDTEISQGGDWCMYAKGGSSDIHIERNNIHNCETGGFVAGQGTGFEYMTAPWLHYEAYGVYVNNNVIHDVYGAALGVNGANTAVFSGNTIYKAGARSHVFEIAQGSRSCDGDAVECSARRVAGGWGPSAPGVDDAQAIPSTDVWFVNNIVWNPAPYSSQWQNFYIANPVTPPAAWGSPNPATVDHNLHIAGNVIWDGGAAHPLGIEGSSACVDSNPTCNEAQLRADNRINTLEPVLRDPTGGDWRLVTPLSPSPFVAVPTPSVPAP